MQTINGYLVDGRFIPNEEIKLPRHIQAILVINDTDAETKQPQTTHAKAWNEFFNAVNNNDEPLPEKFERLNFNREVGL